MNLNISKGSFITFWWRITENFRLNNSRSFSIFTSNFSFSEISYKNTENQSIAIVKVNFSFKSLEVQLLKESTIGSSDVIQQIKKLILWQMAKILWQYKIVRRVKVNVVFLLD